jgi:hypothetical protein
MHVAPLPCCVISCLDTVVTRLGADLDPDPEAAHGGGVQVLRQVGSRQDQDPGGPLRQQALPQLQEPAMQAFSIVRR